jgi:adenosylhomocysteine nucleosidase
MIAIFAALNEEVSSLKRTISISKSAIHQDCRLFEARCLQKDCILVLTGVGKNRAQEAAKIVFENYPVTAMVSTGFSGSLNNKTRVGDIIVYSGLACGEKGFGLSDSNGFLRPDPKLLEVSFKILKDTGLRSVVGNGVSLLTVCKTPEAKNTLGKEFTADSVDMESYWLGHAAKERNVPFITVRSIFDSVQDDLSFLSQISSNGKIKKGSALVYFITHPGQTQEINHLSRNSRLAGKKLALFLQRLIEEQG